MLSSCESEVEKTMSIIYVGGIRPKNNRRTRARAQTDAPTPSLLTLPLPRWESLRAFPAVQVGESVLCGQLIAATDDARLVPLHAPISGTIVQITETSITIRGDGQAKRHPACVPCERPIGEMTDEELLDLIEAAGVPTSGSDCLSLAEQIRRERGRVHTLLLCAVEDEPFSGLRNHLMEHATEEILDGLRIALRLYGSRRGVVVLGSDQIGALNAVSEALVGQSLISYRKVKPIYPISHPRSLILSLFSKEQKRGIAFADTGYAVFTPDTLLALCEAVALGLPMTERTVMLDGDLLPAPLAVRAPIGTPIGTLLSEEAIRIRHPFSLSEGHGSLSARPITQDSIVTKETCTILVNRSVKQRAEERERFYSFTNTHPDARACIGCGKCMRVCPSELDIPAILWQIAEGQAEKAAKMGSEFCLDCGCCEYVCPAGIDIREQLHALQTHCHLSSPFASEWEAELAASDALQTDASDSPVQQEEPDLAAQKGDAAMHHSSAPIGAVPTAEQCAGDEQESDPHAAAPTDTGSAPTSSPDTPIGEAAVATSEDAPTAGSSVSGIEAEEPIRRKETPAPLPTRRYRLRRRAPGSADPTDQGDHDERRGGI